MAVIGTFSPVNNGYAGLIHTLSTNAPIRILANDRKEKESAPDFRILLGNIEIGAAWRKTRQGSEQIYLRVRIDDPSWPQPIWATLLEAADDGVVRLIWRRDKPEEA
jgi:uncharacterized protein (DUF736 family)